MVWDKVIQATGISNHFTRTPDEALENRKGSNDEKIFSISTFTSGNKIMANIIALPWPSRRKLFIKDKSEWREIVLFIISWKRIS